jgi:hypothetical protein
MVAAMAAPGGRIGGGLPLKIRARHVVKQKLVVEPEQLAQAPLEMPLQRPLVRQQPIERAVQTIVVDTLERLAGVALGETDHPQAHRGLVVAGIEFEGSAAMLRSEVQLALGHQGRAEAAMGRREAGLEP